MLNLTQLVAGSVPIGWTPARIGAQIWIDPSDLSTMRQEITGASATTPVAVGDPIGSILNKGTLGGWVTAFSNATRPLLNNSTGQLNAYFNGTYRWVCSITNSTVDRTSAAGVDLISGDYTLSQDSSGNTDLQNFSNSYYIGAPASNFYSKAQVPWTGRAFLFAVSTSPTPTMEINRTAVTGFGSGSRTWGTNIVSISSQTSGANGPSRLFSYVSCYRKLTAEEKVALDSYVSRKTGI